MIMSGLERGDGRALRLSEAPGDQLLWTFTSALPRSVLGVQRTEDGANGRIA